MRACVHMCALTLVLLFVCLFVCLFVYLFVCLHLRLPHAHLSSPSLPIDTAVTSPTVFALLGYSAFVINRIPDHEKQQRKASKGLEFMWTGSKNQQPDSRLLGHVLDSHYSCVVVGGCAGDSCGACFCVRHALCLSTHFNWRRERPWIRTLIGKASCFHAHVSVRMCMCVVCCVCVLPLFRTPKVVGTTPAEQAKSFAKECAKRAGYVLTPVFGWWGVCACVSVCLCLSLSVSVCLCLSLSVAVCLFLCLSPSCLVISAGAAKIHAVSKTPVSALWCRWYRSEHILVPFGNDFEFTDAPKEFEAMDDIVDLINKVRVFICFCLCFSIMILIMCSFLHARLPIPHPISLSSCSSCSCFSSSFSSSAGPRSARECDCAVFHARRILHGASRRCKRFIPDCPHRCAGAALAEGAWLLFMPFFLPRQKDTQTHRHTNRHTHTDA